MNRITLTVAAFVAFAAAAAFAETWDLTKGLPDGFVASKCAVLSAEGLSTSCPPSGREMSGIRAKTKYAYPTAFRFEAEVSLKDGEKGGLVWDDMYSTDDTRLGLRVGFAKGWQDNIYTTVSLGFKGKTVTVSGPALTTNEARQATIAFTYTANRLLLWDVNGKKQKCRVALAGGLGTASFPITIGDRVGSMHQPFFGTVKRVSITPVDRAPAELEAEVGRKAFRRAEENATLPFWLVNYGEKPLANAKVTVRQYADDELVKTTDVSVPALKYDEKATLSVLVETRLRPCKLRFEFFISSTSQPLNFSTPLHVCEGAIAKRVGDNLPVGLWDSWGYYDEFGDIGITTGFAGKFMRYTGYERGLKPTEEERIKAYKEFDDALKAGMTLSIAQPFMYPPNEDKEKFYRRNRDGSTKRDNVYKGPYPEVSQPAMQDFAREEARFFVNEFGSVPSFCGVNFCSEMRDASFPSFNTEHLKFKAETGLDVPERKGAETNDNWRVWAKKRFAATKGIVPEDDPFYVYRKWWHGGGDGWPAFLSAAYDEYRRLMKGRDFHSFWDPSVRCHPVWSSGGSADQLANWVYSNPEPMAVAGPTDESIAMARGRPGQKTFAELQIICYRRSVAPAKEQPNPEPAWFKTHPKAAFTTIPPDALREATWTALAKPITEISFYGFESIIETGTDWYACTAPETKDVLKDLCWNVIRPLGPTLKRLGRRRARVAILESFTSTMFGAHFEYGWQSMPYMQAQRARLDPQVIYEEEILRDGLDGIDVIYAPHFVYTTQKVKDALDAFRKRGGLLMTDSDHLAAIEPDVLAPDAQIWVAPKIDQPEGIEEQEAAKTGNTGKRFATAREKNVKLKNAELIRERLAAKGFVSEVGSSSPEIVVYQRHHDDIPYVFAVNDKRTFGDYVGQWGCMMEKGLPFEGEVTLKDPGFKNLVVYELSRGGRVDFTRTDGVIHVPVKYETCDGRLFVFAEEAIERVALEVKVKGEGEQRMLSVQMKVLSASGKPMKGLWPVEVSVKDAAGNRIDGLDYGCAVDGVFTATVPLNLNDAKGAYTVTCRDRASGLKKTVEVGR